MRTYASGKTARCEQLGPAWLRMRVISLRVTCRQPGWPEVQMFELPGSKWSSHPGRTEDHGVYSVPSALAGVQPTNAVRTTASRLAPRRRVFTRNPRKPFTLARLSARASCGAAERP